MAPFDPFFNDVPGRTRHQTAIPGWQRMAFILASFAVIVAVLIAVKPAPAAGNSRGAGSAVDEGIVAFPVRGVAPLFTPEVQHWTPQIMAWASFYGLDPNVVATLMQIESCGDPGAISPAGAQGLFQVMPFHFAGGEDSLDPDTNARRGLAYFVERLHQTTGNVGRAFAGYNGGHAAATTGWDHWLPETQRYFLWSTGILADVQDGLTESPALQRWLQAGGASLCRQAAMRLGLPQ